MQIREQRKQPELQDGAGSEHSLVKKRKEDHGGCSEPGKSCER